MSMRWAIVALGAALLGALGAASYHVLTAPANEAKAVAWVQEMAERGDAHAQYELGYRYLYGEGVRRDVEEAVEWIHRAGEGGSAEGQTVLGLIYSSGEVVERDVITGYAWLTLAAERNVEMAKAAKAVLEERMSNEERAEGRARAREYRRRYGPDAR